MKKDYTLNELSKMVKKNYLDSLPANVVEMQRYINRYRYEEYKKLAVQKEEKKTTSKFEFTLKQAKEALAEKFGFLVENICIKL